MKPQSDCGKLWTRKFLANNFTITFMIKKYKLHQEQILFEKELALMPQTQLIIERQLQKEEKIKKYTQEIREINDMISELVHRRQTLETSINRIYHRDVNEEEDETEYDGQESKKEKGGKFIFRCSNENCRGFLSSRWKCQLCETWTCSDCRVNVGSNENKASHVCKNDDLETAKLLKKDSKPCPKCGIVIFKIDGCDQMYCTQCHTPFSWKTSEIITRGNIHNPHYYEYMRNNQGGIVPRNPLDIQCGRLLDMEFINRLVSLLFYLACNFILDENTYSIIRITRYISHLDVEIMRIRENINQHDNITQQNRIKYLKKIITEEEFKRIIQMDEKKYQKCQEMMNLLVMVRDTGTDILHICYDKLQRIDDILQILTNKERYKVRSSISYYSSKYILDNNTILCIRNLLNENDISTDKLLNELNNLRMYANDCLTEISKTFHTSAKYFDKNFNLINKPKTQKKEAQLKIDPDEVIKDDEIQVQIIIEGLEDDDREVNFPKKK
jgi:hypothetical protein